MSSRRWLRRLSTAGGLALLSIACSDESAVEPDSLPKSSGTVPPPPPAPPPAALVVSDPFLRTQAVSGPGAVGAAASVDVAYVSLPAGSFPTAISVTIRNLTTGAAETPPRPVVGGGFDPIPVVARADDELELRIASSDGATIVYRMAVPKRRAPGVVRTSPPRGAVDIAVNSRVMVVFTEPVATATVTTATVQLWQGTAVVPGALQPITDGVFAVEFVPNEELATGTTYRLVVTRGIQDADGDPLEAEVTIDFTTTGPPARLVFSSLGRAPNHACGIEALTGLAYCWGDAHSGALGDGDRAYEGSEYDFPALVGDGMWRLSSISVSSYATCGIEAATELAYCWGNNKNGELGDGTFETRWVPTLVGKGIRFSTISAGVDVTCGIEMHTGLGYCWGKGGLIGDGTLSQRSTPTLVGSGRFQFSSISASESHVCGIEAQTALAYCWGSIGGELGDGTTIDQLIPTLVPGGRRFSSIDAEDRLTCGIEAQTGVAYCWGRNGFGQVGDGTTTDRMVPTMVGGSRRFSSIDAGGEVACGIEEQTNVGYCWGHNNLGQIGDGSTTDRTVPTRVGGGNPRFSSISATSFYMCGVEAQTGSAYCWGGGFECDPICAIRAHPVPTLLPPPRPRAPPPSFRTASSGQNAP